ncbi:MAG: hypothetical protein ACSHWZ_17435 [Sulfitobacter sp.]
MKNLIARHLLDNPNIKSALTKALIVLLPSYAAAYLTDKMVYVVPTLAAAGFFASSLETARPTRVDEDSDDSDDSTEGTIDSPLETSDTA